MVRSEFLPIATCDIDASQDDLVRQVVNVETDPSDALALPSEVDLVENDDVEQVHDDG